MIKGALWFVIVVIFSLAASCSSWTYYCITKDIIPEARIENPIPQGVDFVIEKVESPIIGDLSREEFLKRTVNNGAKVVFVKYNSNSSSLMFKSYDPTRKEPLTFLLRIDEMVPELDSFDSAFRVTNLYADGRKFVLHIEKDVGFMIIMGIVFWMLFFIVFRALFLSGRKGDEES